MTECNFTPNDTVSRFISKRRDDDTNNTVRSYETRPRQFVRWAHERDDLFLISDLAGWLIDYYERFVEERGNPLATVEGKYRADILRGEP